MPRLKTVVVAAALLLRHSFAAGALPYIVAAACYPRISAFVRCF
jgi:hypothetical protein